MSTRICPECDARISLEVCPTCGIKTLMERRTEARKDPLLGRTLDGRYRIESIIGRGGMGAVYRGLQLATGQVVAIKVVRAEAAEDLDAAKRFHREARAASLLTHPHTIRVFDFGQSEDGDLYMVLEHLTGRTLGKARKAEGRFPEARIVRIAGEVCQSLMEAHAVNLAHRDMKPDNVMLLDTPGHPDFVKVLDFGIAKFLSGSSGESQVTRTGAVVGTPHYMSPEQAQGVRLLTPAIDVYALGVIVHEAVAGTKPFDGDSAFEILMSHARNPIPELPPDCAVTPALRTLVRRMLAKDPAARPGAAELVEAFERLRTPTSPSIVSVPTSPAPAPGIEEPSATVALPTRETRMRGGWAWIAGAVLLAAAVAWVLLPSPGPGPSSPPPSPAAAPARSMPVPEPEPQPGPASEPVPEPSAPGPIPLPVVSTSPPPAPVSPPKRSIVRPKSAPSAPAAGGPATPAAPAPRKFRRVED